MGASPIEQTRYGQSPLSQPNAPGPTLLGLLSLLPRQFRWTFKHFFAYTTQFVPLAANATDSRQIQIDSQSHFIICYALCTLVNTTDDTLASFIPQLVQFVDSSSQSVAFQSPTHANNVFGDASNPGIFAIPYILVPSANWTTTLQDQAGTDMNSYIAFAGMKSYPGSNTNDPKFDPYKANR